MHAIWYLYGTNLGRGNVPIRINVKGTYFTPFSFVRVCPKCGSVWSKVEVQHPNTHFVAESRRCPQCSAGFLGVWREGYEMPYDAMLHDLLRVDPNCLRCYDSFLLTGGN